MTSSAYVSSDVVSPGELPGVIGVGDRLTGSRYHGPLLGFVSVFLARAGLALVVKPCRPLSVRRCRMTTFKPLQQKSGLFCLVDIETSSETAAAVVAVPVSTESRGRTRVDTVEWAKHVYLQNRPNSDIIRAELKLSDVPLFFRPNQVTAKPLEPG